MQYTQVPANAFAPCGQAGTLQRFVYPASLEDGTPIEKAATVYLPYGYDPAVRYPVLYLMHGGGGNELEWFKAFDEVEGLKNLLDNSMAEGRVAPMIVVTPTFLIPGDPAQFRPPVAAAELTRRFPREFTKHLIPAIDAAFPTLADREHRAFGGFSMGGETTWNVLAQTGGSAATYLPLSGDYWAICMKGGKDYPVETIDALLANMKATGTSPQNIRILAATGDGDIAYPALDAMMKEMQTRPEFQTGNLDYLCKAGGVHCYQHCWEYLWHLLPRVFQA